MDFIKNTINKNAQLLLKSLYKLDSNKNSKSEDDSNPKDGEKDDDTKESADNILVL
ncbi:24287_t:CDS:2 [Racocetra persica]|uniref:24287_t:CDS:1 n=1 Tax=Racocetra persica TaxID=160502 RepID=A0ACA9KYB9_9GLOM|nr:24287_t:CDS:2 [Racocetra persica]